MESGSRTSEPPYLLQSRYRLTRRLGAGGMAVVYLSHDDTLDRDVAVKFLAPISTVSHSSERFLREARIVARLNHPHIVTVYDAGLEQGWHYLVMEYLQGENLSEMAKRRGKIFPMGEAVNIIRRLLEALEYAHSQGVIHRDIKPQNVMILPDHQVKLTDFGLALSPEQQHLTTEGEIAGTLLYMAPEMFTGGAISPRTDLYAVGVVFYELLTGAPPFATQSTSHLISQILTEVPDLPDRVELPEHISETVLRLLEKNPDNRYDSAADVLRALTETDNEPLPVTAPFPPEAATTAPDNGAFELLEMERIRLAGRIESSLVESLNLLLAQAETYQQTMGGNMQAKMVASVLTSLGRQALQQARDLTSALHPTTLETLGLEPALEELAGQLIRVWNADVTLEVQRLPERLPVPIEIMLFRSAQAALERAVNHAHAARLTLRLSQTDTLTTLVILDDGALLTGLEALLAARLWIQSLGGQLDIQPNAEAGLRVEISLARQTAVDLTPREGEVLRMLAQGLANKQIAAQLGISPRTVGFHVDNLYAKLGINTRAEAAVIALRMGLVPPQDVPR